MGATAEHMISLTAVALTVRQKSLTCALTVVRFIRALISKVHVQVHTIGDIPFLKCDIMHNKCNKYCVIDCVDKKKVIGESVEFYKLILDTCF